jgi:hypothetical protein
VKTGSQSQSAQRGPEDFARAADQNSKILARLKEAGLRGVTNAELWALGAHAAHSRISDLRKRGHEISCKREAAGVWRYVLQGEAEPPKSEPVSPFEQRRRREDAESMPLFFGGAA